MENNIFSYTINYILGQITFDLGSNFTKSKWYQVVHFYKKMILAKTWYKTYNTELLTIIKIFKTWWHYIKG